MVRNRLRRESPDENDKNGFRQRHPLLSSLAPPLSAAVLSLALGVGYYHYQTPIHRHEEKKEGIARDLEYNRYDDLPEIRELVAVALDADVIEPSDFARKETTLGDIPWVALVEAFSKSNVPLTKPFLDLESPDFLGEGARRLEAAHEAFRKDLELYYRALNLLRSPNLSGQDTSSGWSHLKSHVAAELQAENDLMAVEQCESKLVRTSIIAGFIAFLASAALLLSMKLQKHFKRLISRLHRRKEEDGQASDEGSVHFLPRHIIRQQKADVVGSSSLAAGAIANGKSDSSQGSGPHKRPKQDKEGERRVLLSLAEGELEGVLGKEYAGGLIGALGDSLSSNLLRDVAEGNYSGLIKHINKSKKGLYISGLDADSLLCLLKGESQPLPANPGNGQNGKSRRAPHPFDELPRWGWTPSAFHRLLRENGFDTSEPTGGGHFFVKYGGIKVRHSDGRFVVVPYKTSQTEITPGVAGKILKACADFLSSRNEDSHPSLPAA